MRILLLFPVVVLLAACGEQSSTAPDAGSDPIRTTQPTPEGLVQTRTTATVLDDGDGAELCLGGVAESLPPQCGGPTLVGWDWDAQDGYYEETSGVRWGEFHLVGRYDGGGMDGSFEVVEVTPAAVWQGPSLHDPVDFTTPCPEPDGGWQVVDPALATAAAREEAFRVAAQLDGYAGAWLDQPLGSVPDPESDDRDAARDADAEGSSGPASEGIVNVRVVGGVDAAEARIREVWGGPLCVTVAEHTEAELRSIQAEVTDRPDMLSAGTDVTTGTVELYVIHDDGTLQTALDEKYGKGVVRVDSALVPAS